MSVGKNSVVRRVLLFGDTQGLPQLLKFIPHELVCGLVCAENRPQYHGELKELAKRHALPLLIQPLVTSSDYASFVGRVRELDPELILVNSYSLLLRKDVLAILKHGAINIHGALLPQYRGSNPIQWALLNNESETGVTMHYMSAEFDSGDIIAQRRVPIHLEDTWKDVFQRIVEATEAMLEEETPKLLALTNSRRPQNESHAGYYKRRRPEDGLIDWGKGILDIYNLIRALVSPHPGAFYFSGPDKVVLDRYLTVPEVVGLKYGPVGGQQLATTRIRLVPATQADRLVASDWPAFRALAREDMIEAPGSNEAWLDALRRKNDLVVFAIVSVHTGRLIGLCQLRNIDYARHQAGLSARLGPSGDSDDARREAVRLLTDFGVHDLKLHGLSLQTGVAGAALGP